MHFHPYVGHLLLTLVGSWSWFAHIAIGAPQCSQGDVSNCLEDVFDIFTDGDEFRNDRIVVVRNDILGKKARDCASLNVIYARGTLEPGNVGLLTGPPFFSALAEHLNNTNLLGIQGFNYQALIPGFINNGTVKDATKMARLVTQIIENCPDSYLLLSGYSQGAQLVHRAVEMLEPSVSASIDVVVLFGDPMNGTVLPGIDSAKVMSLCHQDDMVCRGQGVYGVGPAHLTYRQDAQTAAMFTLSSMSDLGISSESLSQLAEMANKGIY